MNQTQDLPDTERMLYHEAIYAGINCPIKPFSEINVQYFTSALPGLTAELIVLSLAVGGGDSGGRDFMYVS